MARDDRDTGRVRCRRAAAGLPSEQVVRFGGRPPPGLPRGPESTVRRFIAGAPVRSHAPQHAQHEAGWGAPPPHLWSAGLKPVRREIARAIASALLAGEWDRLSMLRRASDSMRASGRWLRILVNDVLRDFPTAPRDARHGLARYVLDHSSFDEAWRARAIERRLHRWYVDSPVMKEPRWPVRPLDTTSDVGAWLGLGPGHLEWFADRKGLERATAEGRLRHYRYRWIAKRSGGVRLLEAPKGRLKRVQRRILDDVLSRIPAHPAAHGFCSGRSIVTHARLHASQQTVIRFDLCAFFADVHPARAFGIFRAAGYPEEVAGTLLGLCTNTAPRGVLATMARSPTPPERWAEHRVKQRLGAPHLPQGAPTSPALSNLCARRLDVRLSALAAAVGATYSRYADDLTFSGDRRLGAAANRLQTKVRQIVADEGFALNLRKTRLMRASGRQWVTGLVVNQRPNVPRRAYDLLKATLHNCVRFGPESQRRGIENFRAHLHGRVAWVEHLNPPRGAKLRRLLDAIDWSR